MTPAAAPAQGPTTGILFSDLDGTLLDHHTYRPSGEAVAVLLELRAAGIWTVPVSSKSAAEVEVVVDDMALAPVAVVEGGGVLVGEGFGRRIVGADRQQLVAVLRRLRLEGWPLRGFSDMEPEEVAERTGLAPEAARRALDRLASEPFVLVGEPPQPEVILAARARELGAEISRGGRFWHLGGLGVHKGAGVAAVMERLDSGGSLTSGAVGDAWNDLPMLTAVQVGFLLGDTVGDDDVPPGVRRIPVAGPAGFCLAARRFLDLCVAEFGP